VLTSSAQPAIGLGFRNEHRGADLVHSPRYVISPIPGDLYAGVWSGRIAWRPGCLRGDCRQLEGFGPLVAVGLRTVHENAPRRHA
jgi:hypothetical protein